MDRRDFYPMTKDRYHFTNSLLRIAHKDAENLAKIRTKLKSDYIRILDVPETLRHVMKNNLDRGFYCIIPGKIIYDMTKEELYDAFCCPNQPESNIFDPYPSPMDEPASDRTIRKFCNAKPYKNYVFWNGEILFSSSQNIEEMDPVSSFDIERVFPSNRPKTSSRIFDTRPSSKLVVQNGTISFTFYLDNTHLIRQAFISLLGFCKQTNKVPSDTLMGAYKSKYAIFIKEMETKRNMDELYSTTNTGIVSISNTENSCNVVQVVTQISPSTEESYSWCYRGRDSVHGAIFERHEIPDVYADTEFDLNLFLQRHFPNKVRSAYEIKEISSSTDLEHA